MPWTRAVAGFPVLAMTGLRLLAGREPVISGGQMKRLSMAAAVVAALSGCAHQSFSIAPGAQALNGQEPTKEKWQSFFIGGIGQTEELDAAAICGGTDKIVRVESHVSFLNGLVGILTWGIYTPHQAQVYCKA